MSLLKVRHEPLTHCAHERAPREFPELSMLSVATHISECYMVPAGISWRYGISPRAIREVISMSNHRTELQKEVAEALITSKAVNFEVVGSILSKFGARAALTGDAIGAVINWRVIDICIPPDPFHTGNIAHGITGEIGR